MIHEFWMMIPEHIRLALVKAITYGSLVAIGALLGVVIGWSERGMDIKEKLKRHKP